MSDAAAEALGEALRKCGASLKFISLVNHRFESAEAIASVLGGLRGCAKLEEVDRTNSSFAALGDNDALVALVRVCPLHTLRLEGGLALAEVITGHATLTRPRRRSCTASKIENRARRSRTKIMHDVVRVFGLIVCT